MIDTDRALALADRLALVRHYDCADGWGACPVGNVCPDPDATCDCDADASHEAAAALRALVAELRDAQVEATQWRDRAEGHKSLMLSEQARADALVAERQAALALHQPSDAGCCPMCGFWHPCPTVRALGVTS